MEYWNLYDYKGNKKNKIAIRGSKLNDDDFHLVVNAWIINDKGEFLITQRTETKAHALMWECTGGSAMLGETSLQAAIREVKEELDLDLSPKDATFIGETRRFFKSCPDILHVWLFKANAELKDINIQEEEVNDVMWASPSKIINLLSEHKFEANSFFSKVLNINFAKEKLKLLSTNNNLKVENNIKTLIKNQVPSITVDQTINYLLLTKQVIVSNTNDVVLPTSVKLLDLTNKYVGNDYLYPQSLSWNIKNLVREYTTIIINNLKKLNYKGFLEIEYALDDNDKLYFQKLNFKPNESHFLIDKYLTEYCTTTIDELNFLAITDNYIGNTYLDKIDESFLICQTISDYPEFKYCKNLKNKDLSNIKIYNYSILKQGPFQKREKDK